MKLKELMILKNEMTFQKEPKGKKYLKIVDKKLLFYPLLTKYPLLDGISMLSIFIKVHKRSGYIINVHVLGDVYK